MDFPVIDLRFATHLTSHSTIYLLHRRRQPVRGRENQVLMGPQNSFMLTIEATKYRDCAPQPLIANKKKMARSPPMEPSILQIGIPIASQGRRVWVPDVVSVRQFSAGSATSRTIAIGVSLPSYTKKYDRYMFSINSCVSEPFVIEANCPPSRSHFSSACANLTCSGYST